MSLPELDSTTYQLGAAALAAYFLKSFLTPTPLVHPILLGRQSDVDRVRKPGESAVYRNYGTGLMGGVSVPSYGIKRHGRVSNPLRLY